MGPEYLESPKTVVKSDISLSKNLIQMPKDGPVVIVADSTSIQTLLCKALLQIKLKNRVQLCNTAEEALEFLNTTTEKPFMILTKTALPGISGLDFHAKVQETEYLRERSVPFIFFSDTESMETAGKAYSMRAQGYFIVPKDFINLKLALISITDYWQRSVHPASAIYNL